MMLHRSQATPDLWERKRFTGPLDIRAPEDRPVVEPQNTPAAPIRSPAIDKALAYFGEAMNSGGVDEMKRAATDVVDATSAYYRMSGVPTFAHDPVPWQLIEHALPVEHLASGEQADQAVGRFVEVFDDSVKPMLRSQVVRHLEHGAIERSGVAPRPAKGSEILNVFDAWNPHDAVDKRNASESRSRSEFEGTEQRNRYSRGLQTLELRESDQPAFQQMQGAPIVQSNSGSKYGPPWLDDNGGEGQNEPVPVNSPNGNSTPTPRRKPPQVPGARQGYQPGEWNDRGGPQTANGSRLTKFEHLTPDQQRALLDRNWVHPTGQDAGNRQLSEGYGYFGASRRKKDKNTGADIITYHGGMDFPGTQARMPTRARFVRKTSTDNGFIFEIAPGITVEIFHIAPSPELAGLSAGDEIDAGTVLGSVTGADHVHMQIIVIGPNGERRAVDPTAIIEKRARTFLRFPMNDWIERRIDDFAADDL